MAINDLRSKANAFQRRIRVRNAVEYVAAAIVLFGYANIFLARYRSGSSMGAIGAGLIIAATLFVIYQLGKRGHATSPPTDGDMRSYLTYLIADVSRQRDLSRAVFRWYLAPFIPGFAFLVAAGPKESTAHPIIGALIMASLLMAVFVGIYWLNQRVAAKMQAGIDDAKATLQAIDNPAT